MAKSDQTRQSESSSPNATTSARKDKFLVEWVKGIGHKQAFFGLWAFTVFFFVWLMTSYYKRVTRRNFRSDGGGLPPVFTKRNPNPLPGSKGSSVAVNQNKPPGNKTGT